MNDLTSSQKTQKSAAAKNRQGSQSRRKKPRHHGANRKGRRKRKKGDRDRDSRSQRGRDESGVGAGGQQNVGDDRKFIDPKQNDAGQRKSVEVPFRDYAPQVCFLVGIRCLETFLDN